MPMNKTQHSTNYFIKKAMAGEYENGVVECRVKVTVKSAKEIQLALTDEDGKDLVFWDPVKMKIGDDVMIQNVRFLQNIIFESKEATMASGEESRPLYEIFIIYDVKGKGKDAKKEEKILGPIRVRAKKELNATIGAIIGKGKPSITLDQYKDLARADLSSIEVKAKRF